MESTSTEINVRCPMLYPPEKYVRNLTSDIDKLKCGDLFFIVCNETGCGYREEYKRKNPNDIVTVEITGGVCAKSFSGQQG